jgi:hypothetical protein
MVYHIVFLRLILGFRHASFGFEAGRGEGAGRELGWTGLGRPSL